MLWRNLLQLAPEWPFRPDCPGESGLDLRVETSPARPSGGLGRVGDMLWRWRVRELRFPEGKTSHERGFKLTLLLAAVQADSVGYGAGARGRCARGGG